MAKTYTVFMVLAFSIVFVLGLIGYLRCVVKLINTDFSSPYKAEVIYGLGTFTGLGTIIGWVNIED